MYYSSTRGAKLSVSSAEAIKTGLCPDGGLFMPEEIPSLTKDEIADLVGKSYFDRAAFILGKFLTDYSYEELYADATAAYAKEKFGDEPAPVSELSDGRYLLELYHGPTCAFKDMALQIMPRLFSRALAKTGEDRTALILVATSGDTGKAALEGYKNVPGTKIQVFYPAYGVSRVQKAQMQTQEGDNVSVYGIEGNFDDAQNGVKRIFSDPEIKKALAERKVFLSSANSINWGRLVPQIVYYVSAYCDLVAKKAIANGDKVDVCVPTGNFGNIFAAYLAKKMGVPFGKFVCASNKNHILTDFLTTGTYDRNRDFYATMSPSMDILISSNLERLLYLIAGSEKTAGYMKELARCGNYTVDAEVLSEIQKEFVAYYADEDSTAATIENTYKTESRVIDTHTAVAVTAANAYLKENKSPRKILIASTASPYKFAKDVYRSITNLSAEELEAPDALYSVTREKIPAPIASLAGRPVRFNQTIAVSEMDQVVRLFAEG